MILPQSIHIHSSSPREFPELQRVQRALRDCLTQIWPTRYKPLCPPAYAGVVDTPELHVPGFVDEGPAKTLLAFVPSEFEPYLEMLVNMTPVVRIHFDVGLASQKPYLSWSLPATSNNLPLTLWVDLEELARVLKQEVCKITDIGLMFVAGDSVAVGCFVPGQELRNECARAVAVCQHPPTGFSDAELQKAKSKAILYRERPWFLMRYELTNAGRRLAVNMLPVRRLCASAK